MLEKQYQIENASLLAIRLYGVQGTDSEVLFAIEFDFDEDGAVLEGGPSDWYGARFCNAFDGTYLVMGSLGGGHWLVYDVSDGATLDELDGCVLDAFKTLSVQAVCVEDELPQAEF